MPATRFVSPDQQFESYLGLPYAGGWLYFYVSNSSTPQATYSNEGLSIANTNPVHLDSAGNAGNVFLLPNARYKVVLKDADFNEIWTFDPVVAFAAASASSYSWAGFAAGSANAIVLTDDLFTYGDGQVVGFIPTNTNTNTPTIQVGSGAATNVKVDLGSGPQTCPAGVIRQNNVVQIVYDLSNNVFHILNPFPNLNPRSPVTISGATADLGSGASNYIQVLGGGATITSFGSSAGVAAPIFFVQFAGSNTITASGNIVIPGNSDVATAAGDIAIMAYQGGGVWDLLFYQSINDAVGSSNTGQVAFFAFSTVPNGWLECNGAHPLIATYPRLYAKIGTTFGGNGTTTFGVPDLRGYFIRGWAHAGSIDPGRSFGSSQVDDMRAHHHIVHSTDVFLGVAGGGAQAAGFSPSNNTGDFGGDETRPYNVALLPCIKT